MRSQGGGLMRAFIAIAFSVLLVWSIAFLGRKATGTPVTHGVLRFAWRTAGEKVKICTPLSEAEKAKIPVHMRRDAGCVVRVLPYRLSLRIDGRQVADRMVVPPGIHGDRPLVVHEDFVRDPGTVTIEVSFTPQPPASAQERAWLEAAGKAPVFQFAGTATVVAGHITMIAPGDGPGGLRVY